MRNPETIKRGLECGRYMECAGCAYEEITNCKDAVDRDALEYILQLEMRAKKMKESEAVERESEYGNAIRIHMRGRAATGERTKSKKTSQKMAETEEAHKDQGWEYVRRQLAEKCVKLTQATMQVIHVANGEQSADIDDTIDRYINALADVHYGIQIARLDLEPEETARFSRRVSAQKIKLLSRLAEMGEGEKR